LKQQAGLMTSTRGRICATKSSSTAATETDPGIQPFAEALAVINTVENGSLWLAPKMVVESLDKARRFED
jgi:hypothetical protein